MNAAIWTPARIGSAAPLPAPSVGLRLFRLSPTPALLVSERGLLIESNERAATLFRAPASLMVDAMRHLHLRHEGRWVSLALRLAGAEDGRFALGCAAWGECVVQVTRCADPAAGAGPADATLLLTVAVPDPDDPKLLSARFGLTAAETGVARLLMHGRSPRQIAETKGVRISTVRTQIRTIYRKTGSRRQADLVCRLMAGAGSASPSPCCGAA